VRGRLAAQGLADAAGMLPIAVDLLVAKKGLRAKRRPFSLIWIDAPSG
jgi:hypothetical protein